VHHFILNQFESPLAELFACQEENLLKLQGLPIF